MSKQLSTNSCTNSNKSSSPTKKRIKDLRNPVSPGQTFLTDLYPKQSRGSDCKPKDCCKNILVESRVSQNLAAWYPGFDPSLHLDHRILGTVLVAESKNYWIVKWDTVKSMVSGVYESHHSLHHSTALRLEEDNSFTGIISERDDGVSWLSKKLDNLECYSNQPEDLDESSDMLMTTFGDNTSLAGSPLSSTEVKTGIHTTSSRKVNDDQKVSTPGEKPAPTLKIILLILHLMFP